MGKGLFGRPRLIDYADRTPIIRSNDDILYIVFKFNDQIVRNEIDIILDFIVETLESHGFVIQGMDVVIGSMDDDFAYMVVKTVNESMSIEHLTVIRDSVESKYPDVLEDTLVSTSEGVTKTTE
jgi:hypothetical protein